jgi:hypothetical protein
MHIRLPVGLFDRLTEYTDLQVESLKRIFAEGKEVTARLLKIAQFLDDANVDENDLILREGEERPDVEMAESQGGGPAAGAEAEGEAAVVSEGAAGAGVKERSVAVEGEGEGNGSASAAAGKEEEAHWPTEEQQKSLSWVTFKESDLWKQIPLEYLSDEGAAVIKDFLARSKMQVNWHRHCSTCAKGNHHAASDEGCRMGYCRLLVGESYILKNGISFVLKRNQGNQVGTIAALLLSVPGNHTMQFTSECSRYLRDLHQWKELKAKRPETQVSIDPPRWIQCPVSRNSSPIRQKSLCLLIPFFLQHCNRNIAPSTAPNRMPQKSTLSFS